MEEKNFSEENEHEQEGLRTWEANLGQRRLRVRWGRGPDATRFYIQTPFQDSSDPDGVGTPFSSDLGFVWERGKGAHIEGKYAERLNRLQNKAPHMVENVLDDLELAVAALRKTWSERQERFRPAQESKRVSPQRVRIEYEISEEDPLDQEILQDAPEQPVVSSSVEQRAQRRAILEAVRAGTISLEEAESQLNALD